MSAISQNRPVVIEIKGLKTSHFKEKKTAPRDREEIGSMGHVERPQSEPANNDIQLGLTLCGCQNQPFRPPADWFDPEINPRLADFCRHYSLHFVPCRPGKPEHKGKVERAVAYIRNNALKGRRFRSLAEENFFLQRWETNIADKRIHGTTRQQGAACF